MLEEHNVRGGLGFVCFNFRSSHTVAFQWFWLSTISLLHGKDRCYQGPSVQLLFFMLQPYHSKLTYNSEILPFGPMLPVKGEKTQRQILGALKT